MSNGGTVSTASQLLERYAAGERDFPMANLSGANLSGANLSGASLFKANLGGAALNNANLGGATLHGANLFKADLSDANLNGASVRRAHFGEAILHRANLSALRRGNANFTNADLSGANLSTTFFGGAGFPGAILRNANLNFATFVDVGFDGADLSGAILQGASFTRASLIDAKVDNAILGRTILVDVELRQFCRAELVHREQSAVDYRSILRSLGEPRLKEFLRLTGLPDVFIEFTVDCAKSLNPREVFSLLQTTFISYGNPDFAFAQKLNDALKAQGVRTFFFIDDAPGGDRLSTVMSNGVNEHDRVILICSQSSLERPGLLNELQETIDREAHDGGASYLIPVRLDDYVTNSWNPTGARAHLKKVVLGRVIVDFRQHNDSAQFSEGVSKLIAVLKRPVSHP